MLNQVYHPYKISAPSTETSPTWQNSASFSTLAPCQTLKNDLLDTALQNTFLNEQLIPRNRKAFQQLID